MSQIIKNISDSVLPPDVATQYDTNDGNYAVPANHVLKVYGNNTASPAANGFQSYTTSLGLGTDNTVWVNSHGVAKWVVNPVAGVGTHTTISAALLSASTGDIIFVTAGVYPEDLTLKAGVTITAFAADFFNASVTVIGNCTMSAAGSAILCGLFLQTNNNFCVSCTGASSVIVLLNCYINSLNHTGISMTSNSGSCGIDLINCFGNIGALGKALFSISGTGNTLIQNCNFSNNINSLTASTCSSSGAFYAISSYFAFPISFSGNPDNVQINFTEIETLLTNQTCLTSVSSTTNVSIYSSLFSSGTASSLNTGAGSISIFNSTINNSNANAITGTGTLNYSGVTFTNSSVINPTVVQIPKIESNNAIEVVTPGVYPYTPLAQDALILVDTSMARSITPQASPATGQRHIIKDNVGTAAAHNITVTPSGKNIDGVASYVINVNYGSVTIVYNGTQWNVI